LIFVWQTPWKYAKILTKPKKGRLKTMSNKTLNFFVLTVITTIFVYANLAKAQVIEDGLVSYWTFDKADITDETVKDVWGSNDGTIEGDPKIVEGQIGEALEFDGDGDRVNCGNDESLTALDETYTLEAWVKADSWVVNAGIISKGTETDAIIFDTTAGGFKLRMCGKGGRREGSILDLLTGVWYHVVKVVDGRKVDGIKGYLNGELKLTVDNSPVGSVASQATWYIGYEPRNGPYIDGIIDEVRVYNRALSEAEINQNMNARGLAVANPTKKLALTWGEIKGSK